MADSLPPDSPWQVFFQDLEKRGISYGGGQFHVPEGAVQDMLMNRVRQSAVSTVPSVERFFQRDIGGQAVSKGGGAVRARTFEELRHTRDDGPFLAALHSGIQTNVQAHARVASDRRGDIGFRVVHKDFLDSKTKAPDYITPYIKRFEALLRHPSPMEDHGCSTLADFLGRLTDDLLTINRPVTEILYSSMDPSLVVGMRAVDGALIYNTCDYLATWVRSNRCYRGRKIEDMNPADVLDLMSSTMRVDLTGDRPYVLVRDGIAEASYERGRLYVAPFQTRTDIRFHGYPPGYLELAMEAITGWWTTWDFDMNQWTSGVWYDSLLAVVGGYGANSIRQAMDAMRERKGYRGAASMPVAELGDAADVKRIPLKEIKDDIGFQKRFAFYASLICATYREHPSIVNFPSWDGGKGATLSQPSHEPEMKVARTDGLRKNLGHFAHLLTRIAQERCHPDLVVIVELDDEDHEKQVQVIDTQVKTHLTRNEARVAENKPPLGFWVAAEDYQALADADKKRFDENVWNMPADQPLAMQAALLKQANQPQPPAQPPSPLAKGPHSHASDWDDGWMN